MRPMRARWAMRRWPACFALLPSDATAASLLISGRSAICHYFLPMGGMLAAMTGSSRLSLSRRQQLRF